MAIGHRSRQHLRGRKMSPFNSFFSNVRNFFNTKCGEIWCNRIADTKVFVQTTYGPIVGFQRKDSTHDYDYIYFKGIPYAKPPIGPLRFKVYTLIVVLIYDDAC